MNVLCRRGRQPFIHNDVTALFQLFPWKHKFAIPAAYPLLTKLYVDNQNDQYFFLSLISQCYHLLRSEIQTLLVGYSKCNLTAKTNDNRTELPQRVFLSGVRGIFESSSDGNIIIKWMFLTSWQLETNIPRNSLYVQI